MVENLLKQSGKAPACYFTIKLWAMPRYCVCLRNTLTSATTREEGISGAPPETQPHSTPHNWVPRDILQNPGVPRLSKLSLKGQTIRILGSVGHVHDHNHSMPCCCTSWHRQYVHRWAWLWSNETSMDTEIWILYDFCVSPNSLLLIFFNHLTLYLTPETNITWYANYPWIKNNKSVKATLSSLAIKNRWWGPIYNPGA